jgi:hypothetical protein
MELLRYAEGLFLRAVLSWIFAVVPKKYTYTVKLLRVREPQARKWRNRADLILTWRMSQTDVEFSTTNGFLAFRVRKMLDAGVVGTRTGHWTARTQLFVSKQAGSHSITMTVDYSLPLVWCCLHSFVQRDLTSDYIL